MKFILGSILAFSLLLSGCKDYGTEGGNPEMPVTSSPAFTSVSSLVSSLCSKRHSCTAQNDKNCIGQALVQPEITNELRINPPYTNLQELGAAEDAIRISANKLAECNQAIKDLDCNSSLALDAFDPATYDDLHLALRASASCTEVFEKNN